MPVPVTRLVVLVSGAGTNLQALLDATRDPAYGAQVVAVGADREDIEGLARPMSGWVKTSPDAVSVARDGAEAIAAAKGHPPQIATLILPADTAWNEAEGIAQVPAPAQQPSYSSEAVAEAAAA